MANESAVLFKLGAHEVTPADIVALADGRYRAMLDGEEAYRQRLERGAEIVARRLEAGDGLTSLADGWADGLVDGGEQRPDDAWSLMQRHATATESMLRDREAAAVVAARLAVLSRGYSGVRVEVLELLCELLNLRVLPRIPACTSGPSDGELIPMSYVAAAVMGQREVSYLGRVVLASEGLRAARLRPAELRPREALAIMSGTSMATGLGCLAWDRARRLARFATALTSMAHDVTRGNPQHFDPRLDGLKPHDGSRTVAQWIRDDIEHTDRQHERLPPDPGVLRCAPQVLGVLVDAGRSAARVLELELGSVSDAPVVHPATGEILVGGNSHGAHVAFALDGLKSALATVAGLLERLLALVCDPEASRGLPRDLVTEQGSGLRPLRASAAGLAAQARKHAMPGAAFLVGLGPDHDLPCSAQLAAIESLRVLSVTESVAAIVALAMCQAVDLRDGNGCHRRASALYGAVRQLVPRLTKDRAQDRDVVTVLELFRAGLLPLGKLD
jgi:histidine ammonia-lyase